MSRTKNVVTCLLLAVPVMLVMGELAMAGKPVPPPSNPTPVEYQLTWIDGPGVVRSQINSLNNHGVAVGVAAVNDSQRGFRWSQASGFEFLDDLSSVWIDLSLDPPGNVTGWGTSSPRDINEFGQIVGTAVKPGELTRTFLYTEGIGFHLLPTKADILGYYRGMEISDAGDVLGTLEIPGTATSYYLFFWTPLSPSRLTVFAPGGTLVGIGGTHMNDEYFIAMNTTLSNYRTLYSYSYVVNPDGDVTFVPVPLSPGHPGVWGPKSMNHSNQTSFEIQAAKGKYDLGRYNIDTGVSTKLVSGISELHRGLNDSGDILFDVGDGSERLYRTRESTSYRLYDILSITARAELYNPDGTFRFVGGMRYMLLNDSNVAGLPVDPNNPLASFDHICGSVFLGTTPGGGAVVDRAFILTPRKK